MMTGVDFSLGLDVILTVLTACYLAMLLLKELLLKESLLKGRASSGHGVFSAGVLWSVFGQSTEKRSLRHQRLVW